MFNIPAKRPLTFSSESYFFCFRNLFNWRVL